MPVVRHDNIHHFLSILLCAKAFTLGEEERTTLLSCSAAQQHRYYSEPRHTAQRGTITTTDSLVL